MGGMKEGQHAAEGQGSAARWRRPPTPNVSPTAPATSPGCTCVRQLDDARRLGGGENRHLLLLLLLLRHLLLALAGAAHGECAVAHAHAVEAGAGHICDLGVLVDAEPVAAGRQGGKGGRGKGGKGGSGARGRVRGKVW